MNTSPQHRSVARVRLLGRIGLAVCVAVAALVLLRPSGTSTKLPVATDASESTPATLASYARPVKHKTKSAQPNTRPIETIRVGQRVLAHNPEVASVERANWQEPDWSQWLHLSLQMPLPVTDERGNAAILDIELLRPEPWLRERLGWVTAEQETSDADLGIDANKIVARDLSANAADETTAADAIANLPPVPLSPLRGIYRDIVLTSAVLDAQGIEVVGLTIELDLPEMGASGTAVITDIRSYPTVETGTGQVVTATFSHPPSNQVLDVRFAGETKPIGVTDNHLFWSVDRLEFLPIGEMELGEHVQTFHGDTKRIEQKLPRPGPQVVYNLEVYGEHVYFVGEQGLLAHNAYGRSSSRTAIIEDAIENSELSIVSAHRAGVSRGSNIHQHHIFPQEHSRMFARRGINVDDFVIDIDVATHGAIHGGGNWKLAREVWEGEWNARIVRELRDATRRNGGRLSPGQIQEIGVDLARFYGLNTDFHRYTRTVGQ